VATPEDSDAGWNGWRLFLSTGTGFSFQGSGSFGTDEVVETTSGDFNGDGLDDIVVLRKHNGIYNTYLLLSSGNGFQPEQIVLTDAGRYSIRTIETNGDGVADLFAYFHHSAKYVTLMSATGNTVSPLYTSYTGYGTASWDEVVLGDFNGDGLTDVYNAAEHGASFMCAIGMGSFVQGEDVELSKSYQKHFGDFNGDGKTDILVTSLDGLPWGNWQLYVATRTDINYERYYDNTEAVHNRHLFVTDVNGDGFDDCIGVSMTSPSGGTVTPTVWLNDGTGRHLTPSAGGEQIYPLDKWHTYAGDFNGDGKGDLLCTSNWKDDDTWDGYRLYLMTTGSHLLLSAVTDGMGNTTEVAYKPMSNDSVHTRGTTASYPLSSYSSAWPLVCQVKTPDGLGGQRTTTYKYENALIHRGGRGILGFEKTFVTDEATNTTTTTEYAVEPVKYMMAPVRTQTKIGNRVIAETETQYNTLSAYSYIFAYHPISTTERTYEYTSGTRLGKTTTTYSYDDYGNVTQTTLATGNITTTTVNNYTNDTGRWLLGRLTSSTVTKSSPLGSETRHSEYQYNPYTGLLMIEQAEPQNAALGYKKTYQRDVFGNITQSTTTPNDATPERTDYTYYDAKGRYIAWCSNNLGHNTANTIDEDSGLLTAQEDANHVTTTYSYDSFGRQTQAATPVTQTTTAMLWSTGDSDAPANALYCVETLTTGSPAKKEFFDCLGRSLRVVTENALGNKVYADVVYNTNGQVIKSSAPYFPGSTIPWTLTAYDAAGRVISKTTPAGATTTYSYNGYTTTTTDALNHHTARTVDAYGNLVTSTDHEGNTVDYEYDLNGHCTLVTGPRTTIRMEYDLMGNRTLLDDPDLGLVTSAYNAFGELTSQTDGKGTTTYHYDGLGRLVSEQRPDVTITTVYDTAYRGLPTSTATSDGNSTAYQYDAYGRTTQQTDVIGSKTFTTQTTYNNKNKVDVITYPSGLEVKHEYAANGLLTAVKNVATNHCYWQLTGQDARGNVTQERFGNGLVTTRTYNAATGRLTAIATPGIQNWTYQYNAVGSLTHRTDNARNLTESFVYDNLDRLMMVRRNGQLTQQLTYDAAGNILSKMGVGTAFTYHDGTNRLTAYEAEGYDPVAWDSIHYTSFHKICYVSQGDKSLSISYGPAKSRVKAVQVNGQETTEKYYVGRLYEETHTGATVRRLCYIFAGGKAIAIHETTGGTTTVRYLHHDHLGSIQAYSDEQGTLVQELSYDAWGRRRHPDTWDYYASAVDAHAWQEWGFTGHEHIDLFEMVNMDGRMYDPVLGRFLTPDPYVQAPDHTQGLNRYTYCLNNPLSLTDPSGYSWLSDNWISVVASVVGIGVTVITAGAGATIGVVFLAGAVGGAASALTSALLNGANIGQVARATLSGAFWGGVSAFFAYGSGDGTFLEKIFKHTFSQGWLEGGQGGNMFHGFMVGAVSGVGNYYIHNNLQPLGKAGKITASAILGGTVSEMGGGKFANGAITGAFNIMFNDMMHNKIVRRHFKIKTLGQIPFDESVGDITIAMTIKGTIIETRNITGETSLDGYAIFSKPRNVNLQASLEMTIITDGDIQCYQFERDYFKGAEIIQNGYAALGEVHVSHLNFSDKESVLLKLSPSWIVKDQGMGVAIPTLPGTLNLIPTQLFQTKTIKLK